MSSNLRDEIAEYLEMRFDVQPDISLRMAEGILAILDLEEKLRLMRLQARPSISTHSEDTAE